MQLSGQTPCGHAKPSPDKHSSQPQKFSAEVFRRNLNALLCTSSLLTCVLRAYRRLKQESWRCAHFLTCFSDLSQGTKKRTKTASSPPHSEWYLSMILTGRRQTGTDVKEKQESLLLMVALCVRVRERERERARPETRKWQRKRKQWRAALSIADIFTQVSKLAALH